MSTRAGNIPGNSDSPAGSVLTTSTELSGYLHPITKFLRKWTRNSFNIVLVVGNKLHNFQSIDFES